MRNGDVSKLVRIVAQGMAGEMPADVSDHRAAVRVLHAMNDAGFYVVKEETLQALRGRAYRTLAAQTSS